MHDRGGRGDPVDIREDHLVAGANAERVQAHMHRAGAARRGDGELRARESPEARLEFVDVVVAPWAPAVARRIGGVFHLKLRYRRLGVMDFCVHRIASPGTATANLPPQPRT